MISINIHVLLDASGILGCGVLQSEWAESYSKIKVKSFIAGHANASALRELTCHMGSHSVTCHPAELTFPPLPQPKLVLDLASREGCKAELTWLVG